MKKVLVLTLLLVIILSLGVGAEDYDFRNVNWGMTIDEVMEQVDLNLVANVETGLMYSTSLNNDKYFLILQFRNNKLFEADYIINETFINNLKYIESFRAIRNLLTEKYGSPEDGSGKEWSSDLYKDSPDDYGTAVSLGYLTYKYRWETEKVNILATLGETEGEPKIAIVYYSKKYKNLKEQTDEEKKNETKGQL